MLAITTPRCRRCVHTSSTVAVVLLLQPVLELRLLLFQPSVVRTLHRVSTARADSMLVPASMLSAPEQLALGLPDCNTTLLAPSRLRCSENTGEPAAEGRQTGQHGSVVLPTSQRGASCQSCGMLLWNNQPCRPPQAWCAPFPPQMTAPVRTKISAAAGPFCKVRQVVCRRLDAAVVGAKWLPTLCSKRQTSTAACLIGFLTVVKSPTHTYLPPPPAEQLHRVVLPAVPPAPPCPQAQQPRRLHPAQRRVHGVCRPGKGCA